MDVEQEIALALAEVRDRITQAAERAGREPGSVTLVAVSKLQPAPRVHAALAAGQRVFGENYVQEARSRWTPLREAHPDLELHLIGPLQTNKTADAVALFEELAARTRIAGFDIVELMPERDAGGLSALMAVRLVTLAIGAIGRPHGRSGS